VINATAEDYLKETIEQSKAHTTGFQPACTCPAHEPVPCIVLDPFNGSGTTGLVARRLGRHYVGLDLSMSYLRNEARERLGLRALEEWTNGKRAKASSHHDLPLWEAAND
jgi:hypothetical protein